MEFQAEIIRGIQSVASPALDIIFQAITILGEQLFIVPAVLIIYWCVNKELGYWIFWCAAMGNLSVNSIKGIMKIERPIGYEGIRTLRAETATGYSFPSGHTAAAANLFSSIARAVNRKRFWVLALVMPLLVGLSRLYLGCHWPMDVGASYVWGFCLPLLLWLIYRRFAGHKAILFLISTIVFAPACFLGGDIADLWKSLGLAFGLAAGAFIETKFINFDTEVHLRKKFLRFGLGIALVLITYISLKLLLPSENLFQLLRYFSVAIVATAICPAIFVKLKI